MQSPPSVSSAVQRAGRAGHQVGEVSKATLYPTHGHDFLEAAVLAAQIDAHDIEEIHPVTGALDVLAQVLVSMAGTESWDLDELYHEIRASFPYRHLGRRQFDLVVDMLAGRYAGSRVRDLRPRLTRGPPRQHRGGAQGGPAPALHVRRHDPRPRPLQPAPGGLRGPPRRAGRGVRVGVLRGPVLHPGHAELDDPQDHSQRRLRDPGAGPDRGPALLEGGGRPPRLPLLQRHRRLPRGRRVQPRDPRLPGAAHEPASHGRDRRRPAPRLPAPPARGHRRPPAPPPPPAGGARGLGAGGPHGQPGGPAHVLGRARQPALLAGPRRGLGRALRRPHRGLPVQRLHRPRPARGGRLRGDPQPGHLGPGGGAAAPAAGGLRLLRGPLPRVRPARPAADPAQPDGAHAPVAEPAALAAAARRRHALRGLPHPRRGLAHLPAGRLRPAGPAPRPVRAGSRRHRVVGVPHQPAQPVLPLRRLGPGQPVHVHGRRGPRPADLGAALRPAARGRLHPGPAAGPPGSRGAAVRGEAPAPASGVRAVRDARAGRLGRRAAADPVERMGGPARRRGAGLGRRRGGGLDRGEWRLERAARAHRGRSPGRTGGRRPPGPGTGSPCFRGGRRRG